MPSDVFAGVVETEVVTEDNGVAFALDDEGTPRALEDIDRLLGVGLRDLQPRLVLLVFLEYARESKGIQEITRSLPILAKSVCETTGVYKRLLDQLTTIHFLFWSSSFGGFLTAAAAPYLGVVVEEVLTSPALTTEEPRRPGFLWVFISLVTFFRPAPTKHTTTNIAHGRIIIE